VSVNSYGIFRQMTAVDRRSWKLFVYQK
jgi:hypothetical protein